MTRRRFDVGDAVRWVADNGKRGTIVKMERTPMSRSPGPAWAYFVEWADGVRQGLIQHYLLRQVTTEGGHDV